MATRQLICAILGHIDHGKTTILDRIRGTSVQSREVGGITQHTGASEIPISVIKKVCGPLISNLKIRIPGLLFIDTPGHKAFSSLRERGGSIADMAVLVIDVMTDLQPQAIESINILRNARVPFVIALNKIDTIGGWVSHKEPIIKDIQSQSLSVQGILEQRLYSIINQLEQQGINAERFDRVKDYTKQVMIIPTSGLTGEGIPELLMALMGLATKYLSNKLEISPDKPAIGNVLEVKEVKGLGTTLDVIIYDGTLKEGDTIIIGGINGPIKSKARALLKPAPLQEMREKGEYSFVKEVTAAAGVKISGPNLSEVIPGVQLIACRSDDEIIKAEKRVQEQINRIIFKNDKEGIIIKADSLGSLEALTSLFNNYSIKKAQVGSVNKIDVIEASSVKEKNPRLGVIIAFNVKTLPDAERTAKELGVKILTSNIIYELRDEFNKHVEEAELLIKRQALKGVVLPAKIRVLPGNIFRTSNPAIIGVEVEGGVIRSGYPLINEKLKPVGIIKSIRHEEEMLSEAKKGDRVAISISEGVVGRNIIEGGVLYTNVSEQDFHKMKTGLKKYLTQEEIEVMKELLKLHREENDLWGF